MMGTIRASRTNLNRFDKLYKSDIILPSGKPFSDAYPWKDYMKYKIAIEALWAGAVADAIGNPLEFLTQVSDADFEESCSAPILRISDDTQMTLFAYEDLIQTGTTNYAYSSWYQTQVRSTPDPAARGLLQFKSLYRREAPGATCMGSCARLVVGAEVVNDSKGNGTVMRVAPIAMMSHISQQTSESAYLLAKQDALLTHKHPYAWQSSVYLTAVYLQLLQGSPLATAMFNAAASVPSCNEVAQIALAMRDKHVYDLMRMRKCGWVAEQAVALALGANLHNKGYLNIVRDACKGYFSDSDTVAGIAGTIAALTGQYAPEELKHKVSASDAIIYIGCQLAKA